MTATEYYTKEKNMELCIQGLKGDLNYKSSLVNNTKNDIDEYIKKLQKELDLKENKILVYEKKLNEKDKQYKERIIEIEHGLTNNKIQYKNDNNLSNLTSTMKQIENN